MEATVATRTGGGAAERFATRVAFFVIGVTLSSWAPLVPFAKARLGADDATLGLLLLCLGAGAVITMPLSGAMIARFGCRAVIVTAAILLFVTLPLLAFVSSVPVFAFVLLLFGAGSGAIDVAANVNAMMVERASGRALMSGFHGLFSVGGIVGAAGMSALLALGVPPLAAVSGIMVALAALLAASARFLIPSAAQDGGKAPAFAVPHGIVIVLGGLACIAFLAEGAILDWSALFLTTQRGFDPAHAGLGYAAFAAAMTVGRLTGDRIVAALGGVRVLALGGLLAAAGFLVAMLVPFGIVTLAGFVLVGLGSSNIVPVIYNVTGRQTAMATSHATAAVTTLGYAGILVGPAMIGFVANATGLAAAFGLLGLLLLVVSASARIARTRA